jgi:hypothetical protein
LPLPERVAGSCDLEAMIPSTPIYTPTPY